MQKTVIAMMALAIGIMAASCKPAEVSPTSVSVTPSSATVSEGETTNFTANVLPAEAVYSGISWSSSDTKVATVNNGVVTGVSAGTATITASADAVSGTASVTVKAKAISVTGVSLSKSSMELMEGGSETLTATVSPDNATDKSVTWKSSDTSVATVDGGKVIAVKAGTATITVTTTDGSKIAECNVTVNAMYIAVESVSLDQDCAEIQVGETLSLSATVTPSDATEQEITWVVSSTDVLKDLGSGQFEALKEGKTTVTAEAGGKTASCEVTVKAVALTAIEIVPGTLSIVEGNTEELTVKYTPENATYKSVRWATSNKQVATVDDNGKVTALKEGKARIIATGSEDNLQAFCEVTVLRDESLKGIAFTGQEFEVTVGKTKQLQISYTPSYAANKNIASWTSSNPSVATVSGEGLVTGVAPGTATVKAVSEEGSFEAVCTIAVKEKEGADVYWVWNNNLYCNGEKIAGAFAACPGYSDNQIFKYVKDSGNYCIMAGDKVISSSKQELHYVMISERDGCVYLAGFTHQYRNKLVLYKFYESGGAADEYVVTEVLTNYDQEIRGMSVDKDGNIYISGWKKDEFNMYNACLWKVSPDGEVTEQAITSTSTISGLSVAVDESGNVYWLVAERYHVSGYAKLRLYKNGTLSGELTEYYPSDTSKMNDLYVKNGDLYMMYTAYDGDIMNTFITKNGVTVIDTSSDSASGYATMLYVTKNGDIYWDKNNNHDQIVYFMKGQTTVYSFDKMSWMCSDLFVIE